MPKRSQPMMNTGALLPTTASWTSSLPKAGACPRQADRRRQLDPTHLPSPNTRSVYAASLPRPFVQNSFLIFFFTTNHRVLASDQLCQFKELCLNIQRDFHIRATFEKYILERKQYPDSSRSSLKQLFVFKQFYELSQDMCGRAFGFEFPLLSHLFSSNG